MKTQADFNIPLRLIETPGFYKANYDYLQTRPCDYTTLFVTKNTKIIIVGDSINLDIPLENFQSLIKGKPLA